MKPLKLTKGLIQKVPRFKELVQEQGLFTTIRNFYDKCNLFVRNNFKSSLSIRSVVRKFDNYLLKFFCEVPGDLSIDERFNNELRFLQQGSGLTPDLVKHGIKQDYHYIVQTHIPGHDLGVLLKDLDINPDVFFKIGQRLYQLHDLGIIHGDLHPGNIVNNVFIDGEHSYPYSSLGTLLDVEHFIRRIPEQHVQSFAEGYVNES